MAIDWKGWTRLPGTTDGAPCAHWDGARIHLYCKGIDDKRIYHMTVTRDGNHTDWQEVPGAFKTTAGVAAGLGTPLFALDAFKRVSAREAGAWNVVPGGGTTDVAPNTVFMGPDTALFCRGIDDNGVYVNHFQPAANAWTGWSEVPGDGRTMRALTSVVTENFRLELYAVGTGGGAYVTSAVVGSDADGKRNVLHWNEVWDEVPGNLLMHLAMCAAGKNPRDTYGADTALPHYFRRYLVATNPQGMVMYNTYQPVEEIRAIPPGQTLWQGWQQVPERFALGDFITDAAPAAAVGYGYLGPTEIQRQEVLFVFGKLAADNTIWMNRGFVFP